MASNYQGQNTLTPIFNASFPSMHLITIGAVKDSSATGYKPYTFAFLTLAPGEAQGSGRTFNFQRKINLKYEIREIGALGETLFQLGIGNEGVLPYSKFTQSQGQTKQVAIWKPQADQNKPNEAVKYMFQVSTGSEKHAVPMDKSQCLGFGKQLLFMFDKAMKLESEHQDQNPGRPDTSSNYQAQDYSPQQSTQQNASQQGAQQQNAPQQNAPQQSNQNTNQSAPQEASAQSNSQQFQNTNPFQ